MGDADKDLVPEILTNTWEVGYDVDRKIREYLGWADAYFIQLSFYC